MANERLRDALLRNGMTTDDLATEIGVDPKTAERWITLGRTPYRRHRHRVAVLLREGETYLWPDALPEDQQAHVTASEIVHVYPHRAGVPLDLWARLFDRAEDSIAVLVYSGLFLADQNPRLDALLKDKAASGVAIRILLGDPESAAVALRGEEEGIGDAMGAKIRNSLVHFKAVAETTGVDVRLHTTTLYDSIYRFDDEMLVNTHVYGSPAAHAPMLHLRRLGAGVLFETYSESFEKVWASSRPAVEPDR